MSQARRNTISFQRTRKFRVLLGFVLLVVAHSGFSQRSSPFIDQVHPLDVRQTTQSRVADSRTNVGDVSGGDSTNAVLEQTFIRSTPLDLNRDIYYKNKLEFAFDVGWLPINIPFPFDFMTGDNYNSYPLKYTLLPVMVSLRWHLGDLKGPWALRGNWDLTASGSVAAIGGPV